MKDWVSKTKASTRAMGLVLDGFYVTNQAVPTCVRGHPVRNDGI